MPCLVSVTKEDVCSCTDEAKVESCIFMHVRHAATGTAVRL